MSALMPHHAPAMRVRCFNGHRVTIGYGRCQFPGRALISDLPAIIELLADDELGRQREQAGPPPSPNYEIAFNAIDQDPNQLLAVADHGGDVVGCLQLTFIPGLSRVGLWRGQIERRACRLETPGQRTGPETL